MKQSGKKFSLNDHVGCFGEFNLEDPLCRKMCSLNIRCAIEREQSDQLELLEDLISTDMMFIKIQ